MNEGILAIWNDCDPAAAEDYERWYQGEHLAERVGLPGFRFGRRYESLQGEPRFFTFYETDTVDVLRSDAYLARLDDPSPATVSVMPHFRNMCRTICRRVESIGTLPDGAVLGGHALSARVMGSGPMEDPALDLAGLLRGLADTPGVVHGEVWGAEAEAARPPTKEAVLRDGPDRRIDAAIVVETLREDEARRVGAMIERHLDKLVAPPATVEYGLYRLLAELRAPG